jgi:hypothetical protein
MENIKIGDTVEIIPNARYSYTTGGQKGKVLFINRDFVQIKWEEASCKDMGISYRPDHYGWQIERQYVKLTGSPATPQTTEQKVLSKCAHLWKTSNWVKNHPQLRY